jgi:CHAT domain-containing protein
MVSHRSLIHLLLTLLLSALTPAVSADAAQSLAEAERLHTTGQLHQAGELLESLRHNGEPDERATATWLLGQVRARQLRQQEAEELLNQAGRLAEAEGLTLLSALVHNSKGMLHAARGEAPRAITAYRQARQLAQTAGDDALAVTALINRIRLAYADPDDYRADLERAAAEVSALPEAAGQEKGRLLLALASARCPDARQCGDAGAAFAFPRYDQARQLAQARRWPRIHAQALGGLAMLYEAAERDPEALDLARQAIAVLSPDQHDLLLQWEWLRGRLLRRQGDAIAAIQAYRRAVHHIEAIRLDIPLAYADGRSSFRETLEPIYQGLADLLLRQAERLAEQQGADAPPVADLLYEARDAIEGIKVAELNDYFREQCISEVDGAVEALEQAGGRNAVLYPVILPQRLVLLVSAPQGIRQLSIPVTAEELEREARTLRANLQSPQHNRFLTQARQLHDWLIQPILPLLEEWRVDTLAVVPDGVLRTIPFATLYDGERFLVERLALATSPGLGLTDPAAVDWGQGRILLAGLSEGVQGFSPLPHVPAELAAIGQLAPSLRLLDQDYSLEALAQRLASQRYNVLHLATHGRFGGEPQDNYLLAWDGRVGMQRLEGLIQRMRGDETGLDLLTLSACQTALGDDRAALGLAGLAVKSGARSAIASLWLVDDAATAAVMTAFYDALLTEDGPALSKAAALRQAQLRLIADDLTWHPAYWGAFLLIGNWL